ncbi:MAG: hypothetical protein R3337_00395 [Gammaproteobacteria bacterium]|nr:hypothetical protein [Gammaproteobacteria bacterium]
MAQSKKKKADQVTLVSVYARPQRGRWRAKVHWPHTWVQAEVTDEQLAAIEGDDRLVVHRAKRRNPTLPTVGMMQPGVNAAPKPKPWQGKLQHLERLREEAVRLDEEAEEMAAELRGERNTEDEDETSETVTRHGVGGTTPPTD